MQNVVDRQFLSGLDGGGAARLVNRRFERCLFTNCVLANTDRCDRRSSVKNVRLIDCRQAGCAVGPAILEDVVVDGLGDRQGSIPETGKRAHESPGYWRRRAGLDLMKR